MSWPRWAFDQTFGSGMSSRTSCAHRQATAILAAHASASSREGASMTESPPMACGYGPSATVPSVATMLAFRGSEAQKLLDAKMAEKGVTNIAWLMDANDGIFTSSNKALVTPADFAGVKVRGLSKLFDAGLAAMSAAPSPMPAPEVYQALQTGVIDAGFTGVKAANSRKFYEVQKFGVASNIILAYDNLIVNPAW